MDISKIVDVEITKAWYGDPIEGTVKKNVERNTARQFENELKEFKS